LNAISSQELAALLKETAEAHHEAYRDSDGFDPEWASWYAPYLHTRIGDRLQGSPTRSELTYMVIKARRQHDAAADGSPWPEYYARVILEG